MFSVSRLWRNHGTKLLGVITMVGTACNGGDHYLTQMLTADQHAIASLCVTIVGALTIQRGFDNSKRQ